MLFGSNIQTPQKMGVLSDSISQGCKEKGEEEVLRLLGVVTTNVAGAHNQMSNPLAGAHNQMSNPLVQDLVEAFNAEDEAQAAAVLDAQPPNALSDEEQHDMEQPTVKNKNKNNNLKRKRAHHQSPVQFQSSDGNTTQKSQANTQKKKKSQPKKSKASLINQEVGFIDLLMFYIPPIYTKHLNPALELVRMVNLPMLSVPDQIHQYITTVRECYTLQQVLLIIVKELRNMVSQKCPESKSLQDWFMDKSTEEFCSMCIMQTHAQTLGALFQPLTMSGDRGIYFKVDQTHSPTSHVDTSTVIDQDVVGPTPAVGSNSLNIFIPKFSTQLRSITWEQDNLVCTTKWARNSGSLLVKMELYEWDTVKMLQPKDYWKHAIHRSLVLGSPGESHIDLAVRRAEELKWLWVDHDTGTPKHPDVETYGEP